MLRGKQLATLLVALMVVCGTVVAKAETLTQSFPHSLGVGTSAASYEHRIDLPEAAAMKGQIFTGRTLALSGKLVIEREELKATYYYVKVRLPKAWLWTAKGNLTVNLETGTQPSATPILDACEGLKVSGWGTTPKFAWKGAGKFSALTVFNRTTGKTAWERVILNATNAELDEVNLTARNSYTFGLMQSDETGRYSAEAQAKFRVDVKYQQCHYCYGQGYTTCHNCGGSGHIVSSGPNGAPVYTVCGACGGSGRQRCTFCNGTGHEEVPVIVME